MLSPILDVGGGEGIYYGRREILATGSILKMAKSN